MQDVFKDDTLNGWILIPATNLIEFVAEEQKTFGTTIKAYLALSVMPDLLGLLAHLPDTFAEAKVQFAPMGATIFGNAPFAKEEIDARFPTICAHHAIAVWAAVETTIEQIFVSYLTKTVNASQQLLSLVPSLTPKQAMTDTPAAARRAVRHWEATLEEPSSVGRALLMLAGLGFKADLPEQARRDLDEMSEIRNILMHRAGFLDETFLSKCPWFDAPADGRLRIDHPMMDRYFAAASAIALALIGAVIQSPHIQVKATV